MTETTREAPARSTDEPVSMAGALNLALTDALSADERVVVYGEDVGPLGGVFRVTDGLASRFGEEEAAIDDTGGNIACHHLAGFHLFDTEFAVTI